MPRRSPVACGKTGDGGACQNALAADRLHLSLYLHCAGLSHRDADVGDGTVNSLVAEHGPNPRAAADGDAESIFGIHPVADPGAERAHACEMAVNLKPNTHRIR